MKRPRMGSVYVSKSHIYMYTLPRKKRNFPEVAFLGEECRSVNFRPNAICTKPYEILDDP